MQPGELDAMRQGYDLICGMGGFGRELLGYLQEKSQDFAQPPKQERELRLAYLDDAPVDPLPEAFKKSTSALFLGAILSHVPHADNTYYISIANPMIRQRLFLHLTARSANMGTYIHPTALVARSAKIGAGAIICPHAIVNAGAVVGENVVVNVFCNVGHDAVVGAHSVLSPYAAVQGNAQLGEACFLGTRATIFPQVKVGNYCTIDSHSFAKMDVPDNHIVRCRTDYQVIRDRLAQSERRP